MAAKPNMKFISTTSDKLNSIEIVAGQLIFCSDTRVIYLDTDKRTTYQAIINVVDEETRQAIETPVQGFYYIEKENTLWSYFDAWVQLTGQDSSLVFVDSLPAQGEVNIIYVMTNQLYRWDTLSHSYYSVGGSSVDWEIFMI